MGEETEGQGGGGAEEAERKASQEERQRGRREEEKARGSRKEKARNDESTKGETDRSWTWKRRSKEGRLRNGKCPGCQERDDKDKGATGGREKDFFEHQNKTIGTGWYGQ